MKKILIQSIGFGVVALLHTGCVHYHHVATNGDQTSFSSFLVKGDASKVVSDTKAEGTNYARKVSIGALAGESDVDKLSVLAEAIARGVATGANPVK